MSERRYRFRITYDTNAEYHGLSRVSFPAHELRSANIATKCTEL